MRWLRRRRPDVDQTETDPSGLVSSPDASPDSRPVLPSADQSIALLVVALPILGVVLAMVRVYRVSRGNYSTMAGLLDNANLIALFASTFLALLPVVLAGAAAGFAVLMLVTKSLPVKAIAALGVVVFGCATFFVTSPVSAVVLLAITGFWVIEVLPAEQWEVASTHKRRCVEALISTLALVLLLIPSVTSDTPWLPEEVIHHDGRTSTGYVVSTSDNWMTLLTARERRLVQIPLATVSSRDVCDSQFSGDNLGPTWFDPNAPVLQSPYAPPGCPPIAAPEK